MRKQAKKKIQKAEVISLDVIERRIIALRGQRMLQDRDLAGSTA